MLKEKLIETAIFLGCMLLIDGVGILKGILYKEKLKSAIRDVLIFDAFPIIIFVLYLAGVDITCLFTPKIHALWLAIGIIVATVVISTMIERRKKW